jgi:hypothetical protein
VDFLVFRGAGGGKCPEEEHTTCSGGPTINCHKRGLWGERNLGCKNKKYYIKNIIFYRNKLGNMIFIK